jgi:diguanylate cyclase (GGDEF)-like protein
MNLVNQLADVTALRDLERLDQALVTLVMDTLVMDTLKPHWAAVRMTVHDHPHVRWTVRALQRNNEVGLQFDSPSVELEQLPLLETQPEAARALALGEPCFASNEEAIHLACFPLFDDDGGAAVLQVATAKALTQEQVRMVSSFLRFYGNFRELVTDNERDLLTGLLNRKTFDEAFTRAAQMTLTRGDAAAAEAPDQRTIAADSPAWLGMVDVDHFKRVNDSYGHLVGDEVLLLMARLMRASFRHTDRLFRFGGEEFVVLLRGAPQAGAARAFEKLRLAAESYDFPQVGRITLSVGFTELLPDDTPHAALERADRAVYVAKQSGRNQALSHEQLVEDGRLEPPASVGSVDFF